MKKIEKLGNSSDMAPKGVNETKRMYRLLRRLRKDYPEVTIIFPKERIMLEQGVDVQRAIAPRALAIKQELDSGYGQWRGKTTDSHIKQVKKMLEIHFDFSNIPAARLREALNKLL